MPDNNRTDRLVLTMLALVGLAIAGVSLIADRLGIDVQPGFGLTQILMLTSGMCVSLISCLLLRSPSVNERWIWSFVLAGILLTGVASRVVEFTYDRFDYDEYDLMIGVDKGFLNYVKPHVGTHSIQFAVHYWLSYRVLGNSLLAYRIMSLVEGVALLFLILLCLIRAWPGDRIIWLVVLLILFLNGDALYLSRYAMFAYGNTFLLSAGLFFLFMRLAERPLESRHWLWICVILPVAAFFSNEFLIVPLITGAFSTIVFRWVRSADARSLAVIRGWLWELKPLLIFPLIYLVKQLSFPYERWGPDRRVDQMNLFFQTSGYPSTLPGIIEHVSARTHSLFSEMLAPVGMRNNPDIVIVFLAVCGLMIAMALTQVIRRRSDERIAFTALFFLTTLVSVVVGSLIGIYPYGRVRYIAYLTVPCAVLIGSGASFVHSWIFVKFQLQRSWNALLASLAALLLIGGIYLNVWRYRNVAEIESGNDRVISWVQSRDADLILTDFYMPVILYTKAPEVYEESRSMGQPTYFGGDTVTPDVAEMITGARQLQPVESIVVVLIRGSYGATDQSKEFIDRYPHWNNMIRADFKLEAINESNSIWAALYQRE